ncbi:unnamed protein product [Rhodiola kirilowii]
MEKRFKVWPYKEGEPPLFNASPVNDIYSIKGQFIYENESPNRPLRTETPDKALACSPLLEHDVLDSVNDCLALNKTKTSVPHPGHTQQSIKVKVKTKTKTSVHSAEYAIKDQDLSTSLIFTMKPSVHSAEYVILCLNEEVDSKFCLCPAASPRVVEAILLDCVPVIIADSDVLDWSEFSVVVPVRKIREIKKILKGISTGEYRKMQRNVLLVQWHFELHRPAKPVVERWRVAEAAAAAAADVVESPLGLVEEELGAKAEYVLPTALLQRNTIALADVRAGDAAAERSESRLQAEFLKPRSHKRKLEEGLALTRALIRNSSTERNNSKLSDSKIYRNPSAFFRSYKEMEKRFKVYVYSEGDLPIVHHGPCKDIYASEGRFIHEIERGMAGGRFRTTDPDKAHVYFMPFSVTWMVKYIYTPGTQTLAPLKQFLSDYVRVISTKHPFWNTTQGADHFMLACHDWGPHVTKGDAQLHNISIRVLCNANTSEGFNPQKDATLPEIRLFSGSVSPKLLYPPQSNYSSRQHLAFFAGGLHGPIRPILIHHWKGRDRPDIQVYEYLPKNIDYYDLMLNSKFCICPSGYEVASPRIVEAIYAECVPVIISKNYVLPFSDVLNWEMFSVTVQVSEIPRLKEILMEISEERYAKLKDGLIAVRKHFMLNEPAKRYDVFHMILHSVWLRRLNVKLE